MHIGHRASSSRRSRSCCIRKRAFSRMIALYCLARHNSSPMSFSAIIVVKSIGEKGESVIKIRAAVPHTKCMKLTTLLTLTKQFVHEQVLFMLGFCFSAFVALLHQYFSTTS